MQEDEYISWQESDVGEFTGVVGDLKLFTITCPAGTSDVMLHTSLPVDWLEAPMSARDLESAKEKCEYLFKAFLVKIRATAVAVRGERLDATAYGLSGDPRYLDAGLFHG